MWCYIWAQILAIYWDCNVFSVEKGHFICAFYAPDGCLPYMEWNARNKQSVMKQELTLMWRVTHEYKWPCGALALCRVKDSLNFHFTTEWWMIKIACQFYHSWQSESNIRVHVSRQLAEADHIHSHSFRPCKNLVRAVAFFLGGGVKDVLSTTMYSSSNIIWVISKRVRWVGHTVHMGNLGIDGR
jgi:hypothetical protein